jgi:hypothetical protein
VSKQGQREATEVSNPTFKIAATIWAMAPLGWQCPVKSIANISDGYFDFIPKRGAVKRLQIPPGTFVNAVPLTYLEGGYACFAPSKTWAESAVKSCNAALVVGSPVSVMCEVAREINRVFAENTQ